MKKLRTRLATLLVVSLLLAALPLSGRAASRGGRLKGMPILAASASYPGLGQFLNGREAKAAVIGAAEALLVAGLVVEDRRTRNAYRHYQETREAAWFDEYSRHYDRRQTLLWWVIGAALYAMTDAYVDAHLEGFGESLSPELEGPLSIDPETTSERVAVGLSVRF